MKLANLGQAAATVSDRAFVSVADGEGRGGGWRHRVDVPLTDTAVVGLKLHDDLVDEQKQTVKRREEK